MLPLSHNRNSKTLNFGAAGYLEIKDPPVTESSPVARAKDHPELPEAERVKEVSYPRGFGGNLALSTAFWLF